MSTFGKTTTGSQNDELYERKYVSAYALSELGYIDKLVADLDGLGSSATAGSVVLRPVIYSDLSGQPDTLIAQGQDVTISHTGAGAGAARAWVNLPFAGPVRLLAGTYWLGFVLVSGPSQAARMWSAFVSGHGRLSSGGPSGEFNAKGDQATLDEDIAVYGNYSTTAPSITLSVTSPAPGTISGVTTLAFSVSGLNAHHVQPEYSVDGFTWLPLCAECKTSRSVTFNTRRWASGTLLHVRLTAYGDAASQDVIGTSSVYDFTVSNAAGTTRVGVGGTDTLSALIAASAAGDVIELDGTFPDEGAKVTFGKLLTVRQHPGGAPAVIQSGVVLATDGSVFEDVKFDGNGARVSPEPRGSAAWFHGCEFTNENSGIGALDGGTVPFDSDGAFDTMYEECKFHDIGNRTTETNNSHGIYAQYATRTFIYNSLIWHCAARGLQLYPQALEATVDKSLVYDCEMGAVIGGDTSSGAGMGDANPNRQFLSNHVTIKRSIVGKGGGDDGSAGAGLIYTYWGNSVPAQTDNYVATTFMHNPASAGTGAGKYLDTSADGVYDGGGNVTGLDPQYANAALADFSLPVTSPAIGFGPDSIQPPSIFLLGDSTRYPRLQVLIDVSDAKLQPPTTPNWVEITSRVRQLQVKPTYRQNALDRYEAGTLAMVLDNNDRAFDPTYSASPFYPYVRPQMRIQVRATWQAVTWDLITVYTDGAPQEWPSFGEDALVRVDGTDLFKVLNLADLEQDGTTTLYGVHGSLGFSGIGTSDTQFWLRSWPNEWPDPANLPDPFYILIDSEWIKVTSTGGSPPSGANTPPGHTPAVRDDSPVYITAVRAQAGTTAGSHVFGAGVQQAGYPAELSGARVTDVFGAAKLGSLLASAETGISTIVKASPGSSLDGVMALSHLQDVIDTENGILYINGSGEAVFQDRHHRVFNETVPLYTFGDGAGELGYEDVTAPYDDERLWNKAKVTASDASNTVKTWLNDASIERNGQRIIERTLLVSDTNEAENAAQYLTYKYGDPDLRFDQIVLQPASDPTNLWPAALGLKISNRITVIRRPKVGPAISRDCYIEAMPQHDITPDSWKTTLTLSDASKETFWVLDDAVRGVLDSTTIPGY